jgi:phosphopantetheinyl transferase (holo-ACP synthase)
MIMGLDCVNGTADVRWTPALRRLVFTETECHRFAIASAPPSLLNQLFAIKEACVKACSGAALPPQIEVSMGMSKATLVSRRGEVLPLERCDFTVCTSSSKSGLTMAIAFRIAPSDVEQQAKAH